VKADAKDNVSKVTDALGAATEPTEEELSRPPAFSDEALALRFAEQHAGTLRFVPLWGRWYRYNGKVWRPDDTLFAFDLARAICRAAAAECNKPNVAKTIASAKTVAAVERLAKADRRIAASHDIWDRDPWLLNTPDGVVDLHSGEMRAHRPEDHFTKMTGVGPASKGACPTWRKFLKRITAADTEHEHYLQRVAGYSLTGDVSEHALFFGHGEGANGKGTLIHTKAGVMGDYHCATSVETFTASPVDRHPTELADLRGARLVTATETEEGRRWAEARIKALTGGDLIKARFMRQDFFEYLPQFKIFITGNHKPGIRSVDEAMRRRFNLIPFKVTIPKAERDHKLEDKLRKEWPGILRWMIDGCLEWQRVGLSPPKIVADATADYLGNEDALSLWLEERCTTNSPDNWATSKDLFASWKKWAEAANEFIGPRKGFAAKLEARGFRPHAKHEGRGYLGIMLAKHATMSVTDDD
jgi:putative DNA primase/helicase